MNTHMPGEITRVDEEFATYFTCEQIVSSMSTHMSENFVFLCEGLVTHVTHEWHFSSMYVHMPGNFGFLNECLTTHFTCEFSFSCMCSPRLVFRAKDLSNISHLDVFSPVWILMCRLRACSSLTDVLLYLHMKAITTR